jgi:hypothetical protein
MVRWGHLFSAKWSISSPLNTPFPYDCDSSLSLDRSDHPGANYMAYDSIPFVESVLYQSPYSGCRCFSGWKSKAACPQPPGTTFPSPYAAPGAILSVDRYQKSWKAHGSPIKPIQLPPSPIRMGAPTQQRFTIAGPSSKGPFTYADVYGICWGGTGPFGRISSGGPGQNLGLG